MNEATQQAGDRTLSGRAHMPPYLILHDVLSGAVVADLLAYVLAHETKFEPAEVGGLRKAIDPSTRITGLLRDLGPFAAPVRDLLLARLSDFVAGLRIAPVMNPDIELQLAAHGDGAFYGRHIDTRTSPDENTRWIRIISAIYYFHIQPKRFSGGALRLFAFDRTAAADFVDVEPTHNSLLVFPSWAPHAVQPVQCPTRRFADSRFAINCWFRVPAQRAP